MSFHVGQRITDGDKVLVVIGELQDYVLYGEDAEGNPSQSQRKQLPVVRLPAVPLYLDESTLPYYSVAPS